VKQKRKDYQNVIQETLDHAISFNHFIDWDRAKVIDGESNRMDRWIREAIHIRKEQDKSMNRDEGSYQLPHIYDYLLSPERHLVDNRSDEGSSGCRNVNNNNVYYNWEDFKF